MNAHNRFLRAVKHLSGLYDFSMHCYAHMVDSLNAQLTDGELAPESHFRSSYGFLPHHRVANTLSNARHDYPKQLRSVILVRLVSEFEAFLIDQVHEISTRANVTFRDDARLDWPRAKLLAFTSIDAIREHFRDIDGRAMSSGGFDYIRKYYQKHLGVDVCPPSVKLEDMREVHARRHVHVHNLGMVDREYKREFNPGIQIGTRLGISDDYLKTVMELFRFAAKHVSTTAASKFPSARPIRLQGSEEAFGDDRILYYTKARFRDDAAIASYFELDRALEPEGPAMKVVFVGGARNGTACEWTIIGNHKSLKGYFVDLKRQQSRGLLEILEQRRLSPKKDREPTHITEDPTTQAKHAQLAKAEPHGRTRPLHG